MAYATQQWLDIGPAEVSYGDTPVVLGETVTNPDGGTHGGVQVLLSMERRDTFRDAKGAEPYDKIIVGQVMQVKVNLTGLSLEQLAAIIPGASLSTGPADKALYLGNPVGTSERTNAEALTIKPITAGVVSTDASEWVVCAEAYPVPEFDFMFDLESQKVYAVTFDIFRDTNDRLATIGSDAAS